MDAVWCSQCGETRWSLVPGSQAHALQAPCALCGGETRIERRRPGAGPRRLAVERRSSPVADRSSGAGTSRFTVR